MNFNERQKEILLQVLDSRLIMLERNERKVPHPERKDTIKEIQNLIAIIKEEIK